MGKSEPDIQLQDAVDDVDADDLLDAVPDFEEHSEISSVMQTASQVGSAQYTLPTSDDDEAPIVTCMLTEEFPDERVTNASRSIGHGLRPIVPAEHFEEDEDSPPAVVVTFEI